MPPPGPIRSRSSCLSTHSGLEPVQVTSTALPASLARRYNPGYRRPALIRVALIWPVPGVAQCPVRQYSELMSPPHVRPWNAGILTLLLIWIGAVGVLACAIAWLPSSHDCGPRLRMKLFNVLATFKLDSCKRGQSVRLWATSTGQR
jgi:hypothetical protein